MAIRLILQLKIIPPMCSMRSLSAGEHEELFAFWHLVLASVFSHGIMFDGVGA